MCAKMYDNVNDAITYVVGTVITYKGLPHLVTDATPRRVDLRLTYLRDYPNGEIVTVRQDDPDLRMYSPKLGYSDVDNNSLFIMRTPARRWKQGIDVRSLVAIYDGGDISRIGGQFALPSLSDCLENIYPTFEEAMGKFETGNPFRQNNRRVSAFSREFAISNRGSELSYRGVVVGTIEGGEPRLHTNCNYLYESLEEVLNDNRAERVRG